MMRHNVLLLLFFFCCSPALAQNDVEGGATEASDRKALLKAAVARDRGEISALEPDSSQRGGVVVGYSSGAVLHCYGNQGCKEFSGTPNAPVEHIAVSSREKLEIFWVSYPQGALYQCVDNTCTKFIWDVTPGE